MSGTRDLLSPLRAAIDDYQLIAENDRIAVGVSGGKDSVALLSLLVQLQRFYPHSFSLVAITIDPGFPTSVDYTPIADWCAKHGIPYVLEKTALWDAVKEQLSTQPPCSLCAKMRRGILHRVAVEQGCNVVALGHHQDDAAETVMMNLFSGAAFSCFSPKSDLERRGITLIRPMIYLTEREIASYAVRESLPIIRSACPVDGHTHRQTVKEELHRLSNRYGDVSRKLVTALKKGCISGW